MFDENIDLEFPVTVYGNLEKYNETISKGRCRIFYKYGNRNFWAKGFFISTVGLDTKKVQEYIRDQEKEDMMQDNLSNKEYKDPFKGQLVK